MRLLSVLLLSFLAATAFARSFTEGKDYIKLSSPLASELKAPKGKVQVLEFFSYACPHCFELEPFIHQWLKHKPSYVEFKQIPVGFGMPAYTALAKAFYIAQAKGKLPYYTQALFQAIHVHHEQLFDQAALAHFFSRQKGQHQMPKKTFNRLYDSFSVHNQLTQSDQIVRQLKITGVPTLIINGEYQTGPMQVANHHKLMEVVKFLVKQIHHHS